MERRFIANPFKFALSLACCAGFFLLGGCMAFLGRGVSAAVFLLLGAAFGLVAVISGARVQIGPGGVRRTMPGFRAKALRWEQIAEVGVAGTKVFNRGRPEKTGSLYIYFSETPMTDEERFDMMLKWPPLDRVYLTYNEKRLQAVQLLWDSKIEAYNTGDLRL